MGASISAHLMIWMTSEISAVTFDFTYQVTDAIALGECW
jgi:hypothetical protein